MTGASKREDFPRNCSKTTQTIVQYCSSAVSRRQILNGIIHQMRSVYLKLPASRGAQIYVFLGQMNTGLIH